MSELIPVFIFFFAVIDPIGSVPVFIATTTGFDAKAKRHIAFKAIIAATGILLFFIVAGEYILSAMGIPLSAFEIAGGIVLFLFALTMIFGEGKASNELRMAKSMTETAIFPLAVPSIASPGAMLAAVMLTENDRYTLAEQATTTGVMLTVLVITLILLIAAAPIHRVIGNGGANIVSRVMGLILASLATASILEGINTYFSL
ncbi:multiple antibiotic resistance (MarC)-related protein [Paraglaciecola sp. T6c]|uniref:MarC family protein n=1 Tax=Pseudoalteromonas atlantica (strain T6c / ATCC BAA-1087) TaxID=3042615 RepID=UPI00005C6D17|nr:MarC family protein [Paraglaciecola sp. T6c]ABG42000.1 multiple antibiotic resistance (MarC)-related protein [Paraglaciecola sp. T6c]